MEGRSGREGVEGKGGGGRGEGGRGEGTEKTGLCAWPLVRTPINSMEVGTSQACYGLLCPILEWSHNGGLMSFIGTK